MTKIREVKASGATMPKVTLGRSGLEVSVIGWGCAGSFSASKELDRIWNEAKGLGLNHSGPDHPDPGFPQPRSFCVPEDATLGDFARS